MSEGVPCTGPPDPKPMLSILENPTAPESQGFTVNPFVNHPKFGKLV